MNEDTSAPPRSTEREQPGHERRAIVTRVHVARQRGLDPAERHRVLDAVALRRGEGWINHFAIMMALAVGVAVMGLSTNSAAVVIGAMLLAPLMQPVLGVAAAIAMALPRHLLRASGIVLAASTLAIVLSYALALLIPDGPLSAELLNRTSPDLRDLAVALAAGAAGAYATIRAEASTSLPGVAVAVALVPPLATVGMTLEADRFDLAEGALLLFLANLTAMVLIAVGVFLVTGFVPRRRLEQRRRSVVVGGMLVTTATLVVAAPLTIASLTAARDGSHREQIYAAVTAWLQGTGDDLDGLTIDGDVVHVRVSGPGSPRATADLTRAAQQVLGTSATVEVRWTQTLAPAADAVPDTVDPSVVDAEQRKAAVAKLVDAWLGEASSSYDIQQLSVEDDQIRIDLSSADPPPPVDELTARLGEELGLATPVVVNWTHRTTILPSDSEEPEADTVDELRQRLEIAAADWARTQKDLTVASVTFDGVEVNVDLRGPEPVAADGLGVVLHKIVGERTPLVVWFTVRERLYPPTASTSTTSTTTTPTSSTSTTVVP